MSDTAAFAHLKIKELEGRVLARRQLAGQSPDRAWHLDVARAYEAEMRQMQTELQRREIASSRVGAVSTGGVTNREASHHCSVACRRASPVLCL